MEGKCFFPQMTKYRPIATAGIRCVHAVVMLLSRTIAKESGRRSAPPSFRSQLDLVAIPVTRIVTPATVRTLDPMVGDPVMAGTSGDPVAGRPHMALVLPTPEARRPDVADSRRRHDLVNRRRWRRADVDTDTQLGDCRRQGRRRENGGDGEQGDSRTLDHDVLLCAIIRA